MKWVVLYVLVGVPVLLGLGRLLRRRRESDSVPLEPSIFDNTIPPGPSPLTAQNVRRAARRLREVPPMPPEDEAQLWGPPDGRR
jgi:hypothetical protein